jgi:hypothetical protein
MYVEGSITGFSRLLVTEATVPTAPTFLVALPPAALFKNNLVVALGGGSP